MPPFRSILLSLLAASFCLAAVAATPAADAKRPPAGKKAEIDRRIAVTIDDLPWVQLPAVGTGSIIDAHRRLMKALTDAKVPVVGFVNEGKMVDNGRTQPARVQMLRDWLATGALLGNHTYGHVDLHSVGLPAYEADILRGERVLRPLLMQQNGQVPRWFRHPYLRAGRTAQDKAELKTFLTEHGYRIAPVTVDGSDWLWAGAYLELSGQTAAGRKQRERLRREYVQHMMATLDYYEKTSVALLGYNLPQIWLLHANELNSQAYGDLVAAARKRGYRFVTLDEAIKDPAYERPDGYFGPGGPSWLNRWAITEKKPESFYAGRPRTPKWITQLAGVNENAE